MFCAERERGGPRVARGLGILFLCGFGWFSRRLALLSRVFDGFLGQNRWFALRRCERGRPKRGRRRSVSVPRQGQKANIAVSIRIWMDLVFRRRMFDLLSLRKWRKPLSVSISYRTKQGHQCPEYGMAKAKRAWSSFLKPYGAH